jgi:hypothetical protein
LTDGFAFVNYVGRKLFKLDYDGLDEDYTANELSILAEHITDSGIVDMAFQRNPDPILWLVREDGTLLSMTYDPKQDVVAWARHYAGDPLTTTTDVTTVTGTSPYPTLQPATDQDDPGLLRATPISDINGIQAIENDLAGNYYLTNDIDASDTVSWNSGAGFAPITIFTGTLDGRGYTVSNLYINRGTTGSNGLFGRLQGAARVANLTLSSINITTGTVCGALVADCREVTTNAPKIYNCHSSGTITCGTGSVAARDIGGLIGIINKVATATNIEVYDSSSSVVIDAVTGHTTTNPQGVGGFLGEDSGNVAIYNCSATGNVSESGYGTTDGQGTGGFVGYIGSDGSIYNDCSATGTVSGDDFVGGFAGQGGAAHFTRCSATGNVLANDPAAEAGGFVGRPANSSYLTDCYAWGNVTGGATTGSAGGFCSAPFNSVNLDNCYSIGTATAATTGGFCASAGGGVVSNCYWDTEASSQATSALGTGRATTSMKTQANYASTWDFDDVWIMTIPSTTTATANVSAESVAVIPSTTEDEVWVTVSRVIGSSVVRYIERMKPRDWGDDMEDMFFVDSGLTYDGDPVSNFTGLGHLEGETVAILGDGAVFPTQTVTNGTLPNDLDHTVSVAQIGIPSTYKLKPMRLDQNTQSGTSKGSVKKITEAVISFYKTLNARYGDGTDTYDINWRETSAEYTTPPDLVTGDKVVVADGGFDVEDPFQIEGSDPMPCSVRAIIPRIEQTGR